MDTSRKASREGNERTLQYKSQQETLRNEELNRDKLTQLMAFVDRLKETPPGFAELKRRTELFGECNRIDGETSGQFYGRLRRWLDRGIPQTKSPRHARKQTDD